jgi:D-inositol-3-phosphate glycosyltransferase
MQARGWNITLIAPPDSPALKQAQMESLQSVPLNSRSKSFSLGAARQLAKYLRQQRIRVLIVTQNRDLGLVSLVKLLMGSQIQLIYQQHMQLGPPKRDLFHTLRFGVLDAWLSPLPGLARQVAEKTRFDPAKVHVVPLGIELERFINPGLTKAAARQQLGLPAEGTLLGLLGRFDSGKGQDFVIEVVHQLRTQHQRPVELVLMGEPTKNEGDEYLEHLHHLVQKYNLGQVVHFRPFSAQTEVFYCAIDVFIMASKNETYGMVTIEAMAAGLPVLGTRVGGTAEIIKEGQTGLLYPPADTQACAQAVLRCIDNPEWAQHLGQDAQQEAIRTYSHERQCELTEQIIQKVTEQWNN